MPRNVCSAWVPTLLTRDGFISCQEAHYWRLLGACALEHCREGAKCSTGRAYLIRNARRSSPLAEVSTLHLRGRMQLLHLRGGSTINEKFKSLFGVLHLSLTLIARDAGGPLQVGGGSSRPNGQLMLFAPGPNMSEIGCTRCLRLTNASSGSDNGKHGTTAGKTHAAKNGGRTMFPRARTGPRQHSGQAACDSPISQFRAGVDRSCVGRPIR